MSEKVIIVSSANEQQKNILTAIKVGGSLFTFMDVMVNGKSMKSVKDELSNPSYATYTSQVGNEQVKAVGIEIDNTDVIDIKNSLTVMYHARLTGNEAVYNQIMEMYNSIDLTAQDVQTMLNHYGEYLTGIQEKSIRLYDDSLGFNEGTMFINEFNQTSLAPEMSMYNAGQSESKQENPDDLLDFPVPTYAQVKRSLEEVDEEEEQSLESQFNKVLTANVKYPNFSEINDPYMGKPGLAYMGWAEMVNLYYKGFNSKYITGFSENNDTPIMEHEQAIYNALTELVDEAIADSEANGIEVKEGGLPKPLYDYFENLVDLTLLHNRVHTGAASIVDSESYEDDEGADGGEGRGKSIPGSGVVFNFEGQLKRHNISISDTDISLNNRNATLRRGLINFILEANHKYAFAEAIIKLLRWGELRPRLLHLDNNNSPDLKYLDLEKFVKKEGDIDFAKLVPYVEDGADKFITGMITLMKDIPSSLVRDLTASPLAQMYSSFGLVDTIVGVELLRTFEDSKEEVRTYVDLDTLTDMVKRQRDGSKIHGIEYTNGQFHIEDHVYDSLGINVDYVDGERKLTPDSPQSIPLQKVITATINDPEHYRLQPSLKVLEMLRNTGIKTDETLTQQVSLLNLWNILTSMVNYNEIMEYEQVVVYDNDSDAENFASENLMRLKSIAVNQNIGQQNAIIRKAIQEYGDLIFKLNELTTEFTDYKYIGIYEVALEKYINALDSNTTAKSTKPVSESLTVKKEYAPDEELQRAKERIANALPKRKKDAHPYVIAGVVIGYRIEGTPIQILHHSQAKAEDFNLQAPLAMKEFKEMYTHFANKNMEEVQKYASGTVSALKAILTDIQAIAKSRKQ